jgi:Transposase IS116/IS110/IS902 family
MMKTPAPELLRSSREFAAWLDLTPRDQSTAGKARPGTITRAGDAVLRSTLVQGATALLQQVRTGRGNNASSWLVELLIPAHAAAHINPDSKAKKYAQLTSLGKPKKIAKTAVMRKLFVTATALLKANRL